MKKPWSYTHPEIAGEWHPEKNGSLTADSVLAGSNKRFWWRCPKDPDHVWQASPANRMGRNRTGCPCCAGKKPSHTNSIAVLFPDVAAQWHPTKNGDLTPDSVAAGSEKKVWWLCHKGTDHVWQASVAKRTTGGQGCPFCRGLRVSATN